jgi:cell division protein FtsB
METLGELVDKLTVVNLKLWHFEETAHRPEAGDKEVADAKRAINSLNNERAELIQEIDEYLLEASRSGSVKIRPQFKRY